MNANFVSKLAFKGGSALQLWYKGRLPLRVHQAGASGARFLVARRIIISHSAIYWRSAHPLFIWFLKRVQHRVHDAPCNSATVGGGFGSSNYLLLPNITYLAPAARICPCRGLTPHTRPTGGNPVRRPLQGLLGGHVRLPSINGIRPLWSRTRLCPMDLVLRV